MQLVTAETGNRTYSAPRQGRSEPLTPKVADKLLELLGTDDEFRRLFKKDVVAALAQAGYPSAQLLLAARDQSSNLPAATNKHSFFCTGVTRLASKVEIVAAHEELKKYMTSQLALHDPHCFEAGKVASTMRRK